MIKIQHIRGLRLYKSQKLKILILIYHCMSQPMQKCDNCLKEYPESKIATHFGYCRRNIKKCQKCGEMYDINSVEQHEEEFHKKIPCQYCKVQFGAPEVLKHQLTCTKKTQYCEYCQLNVPVSQYKKHLQACQSRTKPCDKCMKPISNKDYLIHLATCNGMPREIKGMDEYMRRPVRQQYIKEQKKQQYKQIYQRRPIDFRKKQIATGPSQKNIGSKQKTNIAPKNQSQPSNSIRSNGSGSNSNSNNVPTYSRQLNNINVPNQPKKQTIDKNYQNYMNPKPPSRGFLREEPKRQSNQLTQGIKRPIENKKKQQIGIKPRSNNPYAHQQHKPSIGNRNPIKKQEPKKFDPKDYGGYDSEERSNRFDPKDYGGYDSEEIPQQFLYERHNPRRSQEEQDEEIQKIIMKSLEQENKKLNMSSLPKQLQCEDLMNTSFYRDIIDIEKQKALYQQAERQAQKNKTKNNRR